ncbi:hypothetical protein ACHAWT_001149 [Skeletonema menzelii]
MTTLEEEEDLFEAHLSMDFEDDEHKKRPWQSARPRSNNEYHHYAQDEHKRGVYREPYELLDDVPPANIPSQANLIKPRYPVDEETHNGRRRVTFRLENDSSPYSIDDYSDVEDFSTSSRGSKMSYENIYPKYAEDDHIFITESRSDSEMSTYQSMMENDYSSRDENEYYSDESYDCSTHRTSPERNQRSRYEYDNNSYDTEETDFDSTDRSRSSMSTFDRFYDDGNDEAVPVSPGTHVSEQTTEESKYELANNESLGAKISETLQHGFNFSSTVDRSPERNTKDLENKVDSSAPTPLRSNALSTSSSGRRGESDEIFRIHGTDSFLSSKSGGLSVGISSSSDMNSPNSSRQSEDSAVLHLSDFHKSRESPSHILDVEPHPTAQMIAGYRQKADPPEESPKHEDRYSERSAQEPDGYKHFGHFPDIAKNGYPREMDELSYETEEEMEELCIETEDSQHQCEEVDSQPEENDRVFDQREPDGECYSDIKHKLVLFDDVYEEDEVEKGIPKNSDFDFATDVSFSSSQSSCNGNTELIVDHESVISEDTDIRRLAKQHILRDKDKQVGRQNTYAVKDKDSMESGIKIDSEGCNLDHSRNTNNEVNERIKENESMESYMNIDLESIDLERKRIDDYHSVVSPPLIRRKKCNFVDIEEESLADLRSCSDSSATSQHYSSDDESEASSGYVSEDYSFDDESGTSDDPSLFPSKAIFQMNLNQSHARVSDSEGDLIEKACSHLSRGRNGDALDTLTIALNRAKNSMNHAKAMMDEHYSSKKRGSKMSGMNADMNEEAFEDQLDTNFQRTATEVADIMNNIGVVHEMNGDLQKAMNSFREALTVYRNTCHRFENTGDGDVDRTVSNIMQMGIAMRSQQQRLELHSQARKLEQQILSADDSNTRMEELSMERLNVLMCIIDVESESLGCNHPSVGFTLMTKGNLHLQLNQIDQAIKDCRDAIEILKKGLGHIHPEVGRAMMRLADIYNYHSIGDWESDKDTARSLYQASLIPLSETFGSVNPHLALANNSIGIIYALKNDTKNAMKSFYDALVGYGVKTRADDEESSCTPLSSDVFFVWINVGDLHSKRNEWQLALRSFQKACNLFRSLNDSQKDYLRKIGPRRMMRLATSKSRLSFDDDETLLLSVLQKIGKAQCLLHKYGKSVETLQEALRVQKVLAMRCEGMGASCTREIARVLGNLGEVQMLSGDLTSSLQSYLQSLDVLRSSGCNEESIEIALVLGAIGQLHLKRCCYAEAVVTLQHCMRILDSNGVPDDNIRIKVIRSNLVDAELALKQNTPTIAGQGEDNPNAEYDDDRAVAIDEIAIAYKNKGDYSGAIWLYSEALDFRRKKTQTTRKSIVDIGRTICSIAQMRSLRGEFEAAGVLFDEVDRIYNSVQLPQDNPFYKDYLDHLSCMRNM